MGRMREGEGERHSVILRLLNDVLTIISSQMATLELLHSKSKIFVLQLEPAARKIRRERLPNTLRNAECCAAQVCEMDLLSTGAIEWPHSLKFA